jgi:hypothetical protein
MYLYIYLLTLRFIISFSYEIPVLLYGSGGQISRMIAANCPTLAYIYFIIIIIIIIIRIQFFRRRSSYNLITS